MRAGKVTGTLFLAAASIVGIVGMAQADPIGPDCGTCQGSIYTLTYNTTPESTFTVGGKNYSLFDVTLTIDTSGYTGGGLFLDSVAVKVNSTKQDDAPGNGQGLDSAPGGVVNWTYQSGGLNAGGCDGSGAGFACAQDGQTAPVPNGTSYAWTFDILALNGVVDTSALGASIKARYVDDNGVKVGALVSEDITLQDATAPEPGTLLLLGSGLAGIGMWGRNRWRWFTPRV